jgi:hypothetical protein
MNIENTTSELPEFDGSGHAVILIKAFNYLLGHPEAMDAVAKKIQDRMDLNDIGQNDPEACEVPAW